MTTRVTMESPLAGEKTSTATAAETFSVHENTWVREQTADGRVYFFNRATGASQWHVPNDLYKSRIPVVDRGPHDEDLIRFPAESRPNMNVDCVMEVPSQYTGPTEAELLAMKIQRESELAAAEEEAAKPEYIVLRKPVVTVKIISARGLRDTDFMPGKDKSDPYCLCEIVGKHSGLRTHVVQDQLDPVWDFEGVLQEYEEGDILQFSVWDSDDAGPPPTPSRPDPFGAGAERHDDLLGKIMMVDDDIMGNKGPKEYLLDEAGEGIVAHLTVEFVVTYTEHIIEKTKDHVYDRLNVP